MSKDPAADFRERMLADETFDPALRQKYQLEVQNMFETKLNLRQRVVYIFTGLLSIGFVILFGTLAVIAPRELRLLARAGFALGAAFGLAWAVVCLRVSRRGSVKLRKDPKTMAGLSWGFVVIMVTIFMLLSGRAGDHIWGVQMVVTGLVFLVGAAVFLINSVIHEAQFKTQEKLLEIEYCLAELAERLKK